MDAGTTPLCSNPQASLRMRGGDTLTDLVEALTASVWPQRQHERRRHQRTPLPYLLKLIPLDRQGQPLPQEATTVIGRDVSVSGLSFFHQRPIPYRRAHVTLDHPAAGRFTMEVDISRCRFHRLGWYESGGRLVRAVEFLLPHKSHAG